MPLMAAASTLRVRAAGNLDDPAVNHVFAAEQLAKRMETIEQTADYIIFRTGDGERGWDVSRGGDLHGAQDPV